MEGAPEDNPRSGTDGAARAAKKSAEGSALVIVQAQQIKSISLRFLQ